MKNLSAGLRHVPQRFGARIELTAGITLAI
jgi:hypothetical protein